MAVDETLEPPAAPAAAAEPPTAAGPAATAAGAAVGTAAPPAPVGEPRHDVPALDAVRGLAATAVVATHVAFATGATVQGPVGAVLSRLDYGVAVFFLLSGFLLVRPWLWAHAGVAVRPSTRTYLRRRLLRILPLYWLVLVAAMALVPANRELGPAAWVRNALLLQIYPADPLPEGLTQAWSLATEMSFYLVLPLLAALLGWVARGRDAGRGWRPGRALALLLLLAALAWAFQLAVRWPGSPLPPQAGFWLPAHLDWFAAGMALAVMQVAAQRGALPRLSRALRDLAPYLGTCWTVALLLFLLAATPLAGPRGFETAVDPWSAVAKSMLYGASALALLLPLVLLPVGTTTARRVLQSRPGRRFGDVSYGIFLWHLLVLQGVLAVLGIELFTGGFVVVLALTWTVTVAVSWVTFRAVELPALRLAHRRRRR